MGKSIEISRRKPVGLVISLWLGILFGEWILSSSRMCFLCEKGILLRFFAIIASLGIFFYLKSFIVKRLYIVLFLFGMAILILQGVRYGNALDEKADESGGKYKLEVEILSIEERKEGYNYVCRIVDQKSPDETDNIGKLRIIFYYKDVIAHIGDKMRIKCALSIPERAENPGGFDYRRYLYGRRIALRASKVSISDIEPGGGFSLRIKRWIIGRRSAFLKLFPKDSRGRAFAEGIIFGNKTHIDEETYKAFSSTGTAHILAVSGLHIGIIYLAYYRLLKSIRNGKLKKVVRIGFIVFLFLYGTSTLWTKSITRAIVLVYMKILSESINRRYDMLSAVSTINGVILVISPYSAYDAGLQMSFLAAYGISVIVPRLRGIVPDVLIMPISVQGFLLFYMIRFNNALSPLGLLANVLAVSLASVYVPVGVISFFTFLIVPNIVSGFGVDRLLSPLGNMIESTIVLFEKWGGEIVIPSPEISLIVLYMLGLLFVFSESFIIFRERKEYFKIARISLLVIGVSIFSSILSFSPFKYAREVFVDVDQGDSLHLALDGNMDVLIDGGGRYDYDVGNKILRPYLLRGGAWDLDLALLTHDHMDHSKGLEELMINYPVRAFIDDLKAGDVVRVSKDTTIKVLWPKEDNTNVDDENYYSKIYMVEHKGLRTLVTGDITEEGENMLLEMYKGSGELKCSILKVAHHGSRFSSSQEFLEECDPLIGVISVGENNNYGHPSPDVIEKMNDLGIIVYRTDKDGAVGIIPNEKGIFSSETKGFSVCTMKSLKYDKYVYPGTKISNQRHN